MKISVRTHRDEPVLVDRAASTFANMASSFRVRARIKVAGVLTLTEEVLIYHENGGHTHVEIPLEEIQRVSVSRWHRGKASLIPVLKITYSGNLVFGVLVTHPERWVSAITERSSPHEIASSEEASRFAPTPTSRLLLMVGFLLFLLIAGVALPFFFTWMHSETVRQNADPALNAPAEAP